MRGSIALCLMGLLAACGSDTTIAGGGGFGGETVSGTVVGVSGKGIVGAVVRLRASGSLDRAALREGTTDDAGRFHLELPEGTAFRLEVAGSDGTDSVRSLVDLDHVPFQGRLLAVTSPPRRVRLRDESGAPLSGRVDLYGLGRSLVADDSGFLDLSNLPVADLWLRATLPGGATRDVFVPEAAEEVRAEAGWLLDDFEGAYSRTRLGILTGGGWWYVASQGVDSTSSRDIASMRDTLDRHAGRASLHARFAFPETSPGYGLAGFHFGVTERTLVDLSGFDSLAFWAKGSGPVRVEFVVDTGGGVSSHALVLELDSTWTRHAVTSASLAPIDAGRRWADDAKRVRFLQFIVFRPTEFRLDDLRYFGKELP